MGTCLIFTSIGWSGKLYEPLALVVGGMICIAAANAGGTSQDLKTGYIVGATPKYQQLALFIGAIVSSVAIGVGRQCTGYAYTGNDFARVEACYWE